MSSYWVDVQTQRFETIKANVGNPFLAASNGVVGVDRVLWAISTSCFFFGFKVEQRGRFGLMLERNRR